MTIDSQETLYLTSEGVDKQKNTGFAIKLSDKKSYFSRSAYTFLTLLGDFGGFNDALIFLISLFMSSYSAKMYAAHVTQELPYRVEPTEAQS